MTIRLTAALAVFAGLIAWHGRAAASEENLLLRATVVAQGGVARVDRVHDGEATRDGAAWDSPAASALASVQSFVVFDLGERQPIRAVFLHGDNDDHYLVDVSDDGRGFATLWTAPPVRSPGAQGRFVGTLEASGRYLRLRASGGDGRYSVSELQVFSARGMTGLPSVDRVASVSREVSLRTSVLGFGALMLLFVLGGTSRRPWWRSALGWACGAAAPVVLIVGLVEHGPAGGRDVSLLRAVLAAVAAAALLRGAFRAATWPPCRYAVNVALALCALGAAATFYNLGRPQFYDRGADRPTHVHYWDLRQYYTTAKYFPELGYHGTFEGDFAAAFDEGEPHATLARVEMRDMRTMAMTTAGAQWERIAAVKGRFTPDRWRSFTEDVRQMRRVMGSADFYGTMRDHGANASPFWMATAHLLFNAADGSERWFLVLGLIDPALLLLAFVAVGRAFGLRAALACVVVFGANDFIMFGSNWAFAPLRHDWLAYLALGASALKTERWLLAGALLGAATVTRAFPVFALFGALLPAAFALVPRLVRRGRGRAPRLAELVREHRPALRVVLGFAILAALGVVYSVAVLSTEAWGHWLEKVSALSADPHANHIALRALLAGSGADQAEVLMVRRPLFVATALAFTAALILAARRLDAARASVLALLLLPIWLYPANYYLHLVCLLPLLARDPVDEAGPRVAEAFVASLALLLAAAQYFTVLVPDVTLHFDQATALLFAAVVALLALLNRPVARVGEPSAGRADVAGTPLPRSET